MWFKIFNIFFCIIFISFAGFQYNDPDPYLWMPIYLFGALLCALAAANKFYIRAYAAGIIIFGVYAGYLFFTKDGVLDWINDHQIENIAQTMKATKPWIESSREFFGLLILVIVLGINYLHAKKKEKIASP